MFKCPLELLYGYFLVTCCSLSSLIITNDFSLARGGREESQSSEVYTRIWWSLIRIFGSAHLFEDAWDVSSDFIVPPLPSSWLHLLKFKHFLCLSLGYSPLSSNSANSEDPISTYNLLRLLRCSLAILHCASFPHTGYSWLLVSWLKLSFCYIVCIVTSHWIDLRSWSYVVVNIFCGCGSHCSQCLELIWHSVSLVLLVSMLRSAVMNGSLTWMGSRIESGWMVDGVISM